VHYPSDSCAGMKLAKKIWTRLMTLPDMDRTNPKSLIRRAKQEWADFPRAKPAAGNGTLDLP
jgi:hypothetical protein